MGVIEAVLIGITVGMGVRTEVPGTPKAWTDADTVQLHNRAV